jgi:cysteinyl-tRNA synthetase
MIANTIKLIFLDIVKTHSPEQAQWLKMFVHLDQSSDFNAANMNKSRKDYDNGDYWTRKTYSKDTDCKQYPALTFEWMPTNIQSVSNRTFNITVVLNVVSTYECAEVNNMTRHEVDINITTMLLSVIEKSKQYKLWIVTIDEQLYEVWATPEQIAEWLADGKIEDKKKVCESLLTLFNVNQIPMNKSWFGIDALRSVQAELSFSECLPEYNDFEYMQPSDSLPVLICRKC